MNARAVAAVFALGVAIGCLGMFVGLRGATVQNADRLTGEVERLKNELALAHRIVGDLGSTIDRLEGRQREVDATVERTSERLLSATATARRISDLARAILEAVGDLERIHSNGNPSTPEE